MNQTTNERPDLTQLTEQIKYIIKSKDWYSLTESNRFVWEESVKLMAAMISKEIKSVTTEQIKEIIENSFTEESLSKAGSRYFVDCLLEIDSRMILWSEGDPAWQKTKAAKASLTDREGIRAAFISKNKTTELKNIILSLTSELGEEVCVVIIDDKEKNLMEASSLQNEVAIAGITIKTYRLNLADISRDPIACLKFLEEIKEKNIKLIVDMDGVLVNTDQVLSEIVSQKIAELLLYT